MTKTYQIKINQGKDSKPLDIPQAGAKGQAVTVKAVSGARYQLIDPETGYGPENIRASRQGKDLKVAIDPTYEPFTFKTADGKPTGFDVDIANALCEQIKRKCVFVEQEWDSMIPGLQAKKYDAILYVASLQIL